MFANLETNLENLQEFRKMFMNSKNVRKFEKDYCIWKKIANSKIVLTIKNWSWIWENISNSKNEKKSSWNQKMFANL